MKQDELDELFDASRLCSYLHLSRTSLFRVRKSDPKFPKPFSIVNRLIWRKSEIDEYLESTRKKEGE